MISNAAVASKSRMVMVSEREIGTLAAEIRNLAERQRDLSEMTLRMFRENASENGRRFDKIDEKMEVTEKTVGDLQNKVAGASASQGIINKIGWTIISGAVVISISAAGWILAHIPGVARIFGS